MKKTILIVDDENTIREVVGRYLVHAGFAVREAHTGTEALDAIRQQVPDLIILDLMLPGIDGLTVMQRIQQDYGHIPVIMLTARGDTDDRIRGLDLGADDYVAKPFSPQEVVSRVRAVLRRSSVQIPGPPAAEPVTFANVRIDPAARTASLNGHPLTLTAREYDLLLFFATHPSQVFSRDELLDNVWGVDFVGEPATVTVHIRRLREKIEPDPSEPRHIITVWGVGYRFEP